ncbi:hypothetical protein SEVIR_1G215600v4 [Setaria viridis]|uniref:HMA domain-containing protein n=1 Tax=Setaria viridis TaxID=4556 RepID=A0A4U6WB89_SETVI|nr:disease resistance protein Pikm1-TS-like [Setaria viridis]TKW39978.1 hypothetical protein SEVIR_1G215600v2 [Setaria viridis]
MTKQKIVIKVQMSCDKCRSKAMALVAAKGGVVSVAIAGADRDQVVVVGEGVDSVELTSTLRKKVGPAQLVQVGEDKKEVKPPAAAAPAPYNPWYGYPPAPSQPVSYVYEHPYGYGCQTREESSCSIM